MDKEIAETIDKMRALCLRSISDGGYTYDHDKEIRDLREILADNPEFDTWIAMLFELIEEFDETVDLTLRSPGPLFHLIEKKQAVFKNPNIAATLKADLEMEFGEF